MEQTLKAFWAGKAHRFDLHSSGEKWRQIRPCFSLPWSKRGLLGSKSIPKTDRGNKDFQIFFFFPLLQIQESSM